MQGDIQVNTVITFGPYPTKPNAAGYSTAASGVLIEVFPGSGSVTNPGPIVYSLYTNVSGEATLNFNQIVNPSIGWVARITYPTGVYDPTQPNLQLRYLASLRL
jgi:hypothetical protein